MRLCPTQVAEPPHPISQWAVIDALERVLPRRLKLTAKVVDHALGEDKGEGCHCRHDNGGGVQFT